MIPQSIRSGTTHQQLADLRCRIETFRLSNGSVHPSDTAPPHQFSQTHLPKGTYPEVRVDHLHGDAPHTGDTRIESNIGQVSEGFNAEQNHLLNMPENSEVNRRYLGQS